jgi:hypothetical protein
MSEVDVERIVLETQFGEDNDEVIEALASSFKMAVDGVLKVIKGLPGVNEDELSDLVLRTEVAHTLIYPFSNAVHLGDTLAWQPGEFETVLIAEHHDTFEREREKFEQDLRDMVVERAGMHGRSADQLVDDISELALNNVDMLVEWADEESERMQADQAPVQIGGMPE